MWFMDNTNVHDQRSFSVVESLLIPFRASNWYKFSPKYQLASYRVYRPEKVERSIILVKTVDGYDIEFSPGRPKGWAIGIYYRQF